MANPEHLAILKEGVEAWNQWRKDYRHIQVDLTGAELPSANFSHIDFTAADLSRADFSRADLSYANLTNAILSRAKLSAFISYTKRSGSIHTQANLSHANLSGTYLFATELTGVDLSNANLSNANLFNADLSYANLSYANLRYAVLVATRLGAADLSHADLSNTNLINIDLTDANLTRARLNATVFAATTHLSSVKGLESIVHNGPSTIGIDTMIRAQGNLPEVFLRGAGVPESFITNMKSLISAMEPIQFYSCFISYSTKDQDFADRLYADLQAKGIRCWFAPHDIQGGRKIHEQIDEAIRVYDRLLLILSEASMNSKWVTTEIANARAREEREKRQMLFPLAIAPYEAIEQWTLFDADRHLDSAREIREYFIPDFSNWKDHNSYQKAFERVLKDLQAASKKQSA